jgi:hypothetical protein
MLLLKQGLNNISTLFSGSEEEKLPEPKKNDKKNGYLND